jgi:hypothetical protein
LASEVADAAGPHLLHDRLRSLPVQLSMGYRSES